MTAAAPQPRRPRLTQKELRAINEALASSLAGEIWIDGEDPAAPRYEDYGTAQEKIQGRINWRPDEFDDLD